jgi:2',3'-cyclic-nucleotide 2'-phosphodiesterase (5'-nucleotidase family)
MDSGNFSGNPTPRDEKQTRTLLEAMGRLDYKVVNVGERDIRMGYEQFAALTEGSELTYISANIVKKGSGEPIFEPYAIVELEDEGSRRPVRVGVIGVARYNPVFLKSGPDGSNMVIAHHVDSVRKQVSALRDEKVDVIVLLAALHMADAKRIAEEVDGIDYVLGAYGGMFNQEDLGATSILYCGNRGQRLGEARVFLADDLTKNAAPITASDTVRMHFLTKEYPDSLEMRRFLDSVVGPDASAVQSKSSAESPAAEPRAAR